MSNNNQISIFDVKELYDAAYEEQHRLICNFERFTTLMAKALKLDEQYRAQLADTPAFAYVRAAA